MKKSSLWKVAWKLQWKKFFTQEKKKKRKISYSSIFHSWSWMVFTDIVWNRRRVKITISNADVCKAFLFYPKDLTWVYIRMLLTWVENGNFYGFFLRNKGITIFLLMVNWGKKIKKKYLRIFFSKMEQCWIKTLKQEAFKSFVHSWRIFLFSFIFFYASFCGSFIKLFPHTPTPRKHFREK